MELAAFSRVPLLSIVIRAFVIAPGKAESTHAHTLLHYAVALYIIPRRLLGAL